MNAEELKRIERMERVLAAAKVEGARTEWREKGDCRWIEESEYPWAFVENDYRVLHLVPGESRPITAADWDEQPTVWVRAKGVAHRFYQVHFIGEVSFAFRNGDNQDSQPPFNNDKYEYSFDRKTWHPFVKQTGESWKVVASTDPEDPSNKEGK